MQGYKHKRAFIVAEGPMKSTVRNFWKMIYERNCAVVVMTSSLIEGGQEASAQYWPDSGIAHYGEFAVDLLGEEKLQGFTIRNLSVLNTKVCPQTEYYTHAGYAMSLCFRLRRHIKLLSSTSRAGGLMVIAPT